MNITMLDNIAWHALSGPHLKFAVGGPTARRYEIGFSPIVAYESCEHPDFEALTQQCDIGEHLYCSGWSGPAVKGWEILTDTSAYLMTWPGRLPELLPIKDIKILSSEDLPQVLKLAKLANLDPFGPRALELGIYLGIYEGDELVSMGWERMHAGRFREISSLATHPDYQGLGYARAILGRLLDEHLKRQEYSFLHVMHDNTHALRIYERMGFKILRETPVRVMSISSK